MLGGKLVPWGAGRITEPGIFFAKMAMESRRALPTTLALTKGAGAVVRTAWLS